MIGEELRVFEEGRVRINCRELALCQLILYSIVVTLRGTANILRKTYVKPIKSVTNLIFNLLTERRSVNGKNPHKPLIYKVLGNTRLSEQIP